MMNLPVKLTFATKAGDVLVSARSAAAEGRGDIIDTKSLLLGNAERPSPLS